MAKDVTFEEFNEYLQQTAPNIEKELAKTIELCCQKVVGDIQSSMAQTPRNTSKSYYTNNKKIAHHPSLPGNPPAPDTGNLRNSIRYEIHGQNSKEVYGIVGSTQKDPPYGTYLEYGTTKGGWGGKGIAPRPWLRPAMIKNEDFIRKSLADAVKKTLVGGNV